MLDSLKKFYDKIYAADTFGQYQAIIAECIEDLGAAGWKHLAEEVGRLSAVCVNRFSKQATYENFENSKKKVLDYLKKENDVCQEISEKEGVRIITTILEHFHDYCRCLYKDKIHKKCSDSLKRNLPYLKVENEYDVQRLMYPVIRSIFPDTRLEEAEDSGHHMKANA